MFGKSKKYALSVVIFLLAFLVIYFASNVFFIWKIIDVKKLPVYSTPEDAFLNYKEVEFSASGGPLLSGWLINGREGAPVIVACHDLGSNKEGLLNSVVELNKAGYSVLLFDFRGHGESRGRTTLGMKEADDVIAAVLTLENKFNYKRSRIGLYGVSMGAYSIIAAAGTLPGITAIAADSPYATISYFIENSLLNEQKISFFFPPVNNFIFSCLTAGWTSPDLEKTVAKLDGTNLLFLVENSDEDSYGQSKLIYSAADESYASIVGLSATMKSSLYDEEKRNYENQILGFFKSCLPLEKEDDGNFDLIIE